MIASLVAVKVTQVAAGTAHTVICTAEGRVLAFGGDVDRSLWPKLVPYVESEDFVGNSEEEEGDDSESEEVSGDGSEDEGDEGVDGES
jgi:alpha-tubulin suppressor-like RCC1 family protein